MLSAQGARLVVVGKLLAGRDGARGDDGHVLDAVDGHDLCVRVGGAAVVDVARLVALRAADACTHLWSKEVVSGHVTQDGGFV